MASSQQKLARPGPMPINERDVVEALTVRIEVMHPAAAVFSNSEMLEWPKGVHNALVRQGLLTKIERADTVVCLGCDAQCMKPVVFRVDHADRSRRAFINCDEPADHGRIRVLPSQLQQFNITLHRLSVFVAGALGLAGATASGNDSTFRLGEAKGRNGPRNIFIRLKSGRLQFLAEAEHVDLVSVLQWASNAVTVDKTKVKRLLDRKQSSASMGRKYVPDRGKQAANRNATSVRDRQLRKLAVRMIEAEGLTTTMAAERISKMKIAVTKNGQRLSPGRVRRIITERAR